LEAEAMQLVEHSTRHQDVALGESSHTQKPSQPVCEHSWGNPTIGKLPLAFKKNPRQWAGWKQPW